MSAIHPASQPSWFLLAAKMLWTLFWRYGCHLTEIDLVIFLYFLFFPTLKMKASSLSISPPTHLVLIANCLFWELFFSLSLHFHARDETKQSKCYILHPNHVPNTAQLQEVVFFRRLKLIAITGLKKKLIFRLQINVH